MRILAIATFLTPSVWTSHSVLLTLGRGKQYLRLKIVENLLFLLLVGIGLNFGAIGVAAASPVLILLLMGPTLWYCFRDSPISQTTFWQGVAKPLVSSLVMAGVLLALNQAFPISQPFVSALRGGIVGGITYLICFCLLPGGLGELRQLVGDVRGAFNKKATRAATEALSADTGTARTCVGASGKV